MATSSVGTGTASSTSLSQQAAEIQKQIAAAMNQAQTGKTADQIKGFQKTNTKSALNSQVGATDIGLLRPNKTRLNGYSTLGKTDKVDFVKFRVQQGGQIKMGALGTGTLRFQLMTQGGVVIADNDPKADKSRRDTFDKLGDGKLDVKAGVYLVKITRRTDAPLANVKDTNYSVQFSMGGYTEDYDTIMKAPAAGADPFAPPNSVNQISTMLNDMMTNMNNLPAIGTSATDKLMGQWLNLLA